MAEIDQDSEIRELRERLALLEQGNGGSGAPPPKVPKRKSGCMLFAVVGGGIFILLAIIGSCLPEQPAADSANESPASVEAVSSPAEVAPPISIRSAWVYRTNIDEMTDKPTHFACVTSTNKVNLDWPYSDVSADLCVRQSPQYGLDAYVSLNGDGQILCRVYDGCTVKIRFDDGAQQSFSAADAADHSSNIIFINNTQRLVQNLKNAELTRIEIALYQAGNQVLNFPTKDLEWPRPAG